MSALLGILVTGSHIELEDLNSWPVPVRSAFERSVELFRNYETELRRIDMRARRNVMSRLNPPDNKYAAERNRIVAEASDQIKGRTLLGYHCSRLHRDEIAHIRANGMVTLSLDSLRSRIEARVVDGDLSAETGQVLLANNDAGDEWRTGQTWFINSRSELDDENGVYRLFRSWGGEALYRQHEADPNIGAALRMIGTPCIIIASIPIDNRYWIFSDIGEHFYSVFLHSLDIPQANGHTLQGYMREELPSECIIDVLQFGTPEFERLTKFRKWQKSIG